MSPTPLGTPVHHLAPPPPPPYTPPSPPSWAGRTPPPGPAWPQPAAAPVPPGPHSRPAGPTGRRAKRGVALLVAIALLLAATGVVVGATLGLGRLNPFSSAGGVPAGGTVHYRGAMVVVDPPVTERTPSGTFRVTARATVTNTAKWTDDSKHVTNLESSPPQLVIDGKRVGATVAMDDVPAGASGPATFTFDNYPAEPDLSRATLEFGDATSKIGKIGDTPATLAPVPVQLAGQLTTGPDTTTVTVVSSELRADIGETEVPAGKLALRIRYRFKSGTNYTNGAAARWAHTSLSLRAPDGTTYQPDDGTTAKSGDGEGTVVYLVPDGSTGTFTLTDTYVGCCGTAHGSLDFTMPAFGPTGTATAA